MGAPPGFTETRLIDPFEIHVGPVFERGGLSRTTPSARDSGSPCHPFTLSPGHPAASYIIRTLTIDFLVSILAGSRSKM